MNENIDSDIEKVQLSGKDKEEQKNNLITLDEILKSKPEKENENKKEKKKTESSLLSEEKISDDIACSIRNRRKYCYGKSSLCLWTKIGSILIWF